MAKFKVPERAEDCKTIREKVAYSMMVREQYETIVCSHNSLPSDLGVFQDRFPYDPAMPWSSPEFASDWARAERERRAILRLLPDDE